MDRIAKTLSLSSEMYDASRGGFSTSARTPAENRSPSLPVATPCVLATLTCARWVFHATVAIGLLSSLPDNIRLMPNTWLRGLNQSRFRSRLDVSLLQSSTKRFIMSNIGSLAR
jgi:hypothetical protein